MNSRAPASLAALVVVTKLALASTVPITDSNIAFSPYNWYKSGPSYAQSPNPGAYLKLGFTGTSIAVKLDVSTFEKANVPAPQYPLVRYSVDGGPPVTVQLSPLTESIQCAKGLAGGKHSLQLEYVAGYVFLDFWTPVNVLRVAGFTLDDGASTVAPFGPVARRPRYALFLGDSITNGDDDVATFADGITNTVQTQDATRGYPTVVAAGIGAEYGIVAYGGASWNHGAADGHTPGLPTFYSMLDSVHSRLVGGRLSPVPDDIFINMGENSGPTGDQVAKLLGALRTESSSQTNIFVIVPFSGRSRPSLTSGFASYAKTASSDSRDFLIDLGNNPFLTARGPTLFSVDGQHPLVNLHALLGAQLVEARAQSLRGH